MPGFVMFDHPLKSRQPTRVTGCCFLRSTGKIGFQTESEGLPQRHQDTEIYLYFPTDISFLFILGQPGVFEPWWLTLSGCRSVPVWMQSRH
jgi:hypothetical protein